LLFVARIREGEWEELEEQFRVLEEH
jgi:hypothetical protein